MGQWYFHIMRVTTFLQNVKVKDCRSQWPRGLKHRSTAARLLTLWVRIPPGDGRLSGMRVVCVVRHRFLRRADHSSRGVLPTAVRRCVRSRILVSEEALVNWGLSRQKQTTERMRKRNITNTVVTGTHN